MGVRIGSVWTKTNEDGSKTTNGEMNCPCGINIPAGVSAKISIIANEKHQQGDNLPSGFIEVWIPKN